MEPHKVLGELLKEQGAVAFGITTAGPVEEEEWHLFENWIEAGYHAGMSYMRNYPELRRDPRLLLEGARSIVSIAFNYRQTNPWPRVATYALGEDYHKVLCRRLKKVVVRMKELLGGDWRICIDSAPLLERYWARRCGVGHRSSVHGNVIVDGVGSMVFLAELLTSLPLDEYSENFVGTSHATEGGPAVCPTGALLPGGVVDASRCINYLTIEHRGPLSPEQQKLVGNAFFGCDACQRACVENSGTTLTVLPEFQPLPGLEAFLSGNPDTPFPLENSPIKRKFSRR